MAEGGKTGFDEFYDYARHRQVVDAIEKDLSALDSQFTKFATTLKSFGSNFKKSLDETQASMKANTESMKLLDKTQLASIDSITNLTKQNEQYAKVGKQYAATNKAIETSIKAFSGSVDGQKEKIKALTAEFNSLDPKVKKNQQRLEQLSKELIKAKNTVNEMSKATRDSNNVLNRAEGSYNALTAAIAKDVAALKQIPGAVDKSSSAYKKNEKQITSLQARINTNTNALKQFDAQMGRNFRNVGNYSSALGGLGRTAASFASAFGFVGGTFLIAQGIKDSIGIIVDFQKENAVLAGVLDKTRDEISALTNDAERLGSTTAKTASEVTQLQIAYARLGFSQEEILALTGDTINGSIALNASLDETASLTGAIVRTFDDLGTSDADVILDQLTAATQQSALNFEKLQTAIPIVAGAANAAGVPFTKLLALLGKLSDAGIDASMSSTALRNIFIESASQGLNYEQILAKISNEQDKLTASNDQFGKRAAVSATILSNLIQETNDLDTSLQNVGGTAKRVAYTNLDTLSGSVDLLKSAFEGLILSLDSGEGGLSGFLREFVDTLTEALIAMQNFDLVLNTTFKKFKDIKDKDIMRLVDVGLLTESGKKVKEFTGLLDEIPYDDLAKNREKYRDRVISWFQSEGESLIDSQRLFHAYFQSRKSEQDSLTQSQDYLTLAQTNGIKSFDEFMSAYGDSVLGMENGERILNLVKAGYENLGNSLIPPIDKTKGLTDAQKELSKELEKLKGKSLEDIFKISVSDSETPLIEAERKVQEFLDFMKKEVDSINFDDNIGSVVENMILGDNPENLTDREKALLKEAEDVGDAFRDREIQKLQDKERLKQEIVRGSFDVINSFADTFFTNQQIRFGNELNLLQQQKDKELSLAGDNAQARAAIEAKFEDQRRKIQQDQADAQRRATLFSLGLKIPEAIITGLLTGGPPLAALYGTIATAELIAASAIEVPVFGDGTDDAPGGAVIVNERNKRELITTPEGKSFYFDKRGAVLTDMIPKGSTIDPRDISELTNVSDLIKDYSPISGQHAKMLEDFKMKDLLYNININNTSSIDYDRLAAIIAEKMPANQQFIIKEGKVQQLSIKGKTKKITGSVDILKGHPIYKEIEAINKKMKK